MRRRRDQHAYSVRMKYLRDRLQRMPNCPRALMQPDFGHLGYGKRGISIPTSGTNGRLLLEKMPAFGFTSTNQVFRG
jgi:hypothetical protein